MRTLARWIVLLFVVLAPGWLSSATYFVATNGNDQDNGLFPAYLGDKNGPFRTLTRAAAALKAGDALEIRGGTYSEKVDFSADGTPSSRITISNYNNEPVIIDGQYELPAGNVYLFLVLVSGDHVTLSNVVIKNSAGSLLALAGDYTYASNIVGEGSRETGMCAVGRYNIFDGCSMTDSGNGYGVSGQRSWGSAIGTSGFSTTIQNCLAHDNRGEGFNAGGAAVNSVIQDCVAYNNGALNIYNDSADGTIIRRNLVYCTSGSKYGPCPGIVIGAESKVPSNLQIVNNLCLGNWINLVSDSTVTSADGFLIAHNTFVNTLKTADDIAKGYNMGVYFRPQLSSFSNSRFMNNIVIEEDSGQIPINTTLAGSHAGFLFSNNCWNETPTSAAAGPGDVIADPLLVRSGASGAGTLSSGWFRISAGSPARDRAAVLGEVNQDFFKNPRGNAPDIGAHEFISVAGGTADLVLAVQTGSPAVGTGGLTEPAPGIVHSFPVGSQVVIQSFPNEGFRFSKWTGDLPVGEAFDRAPIITLDTSKSFSAVFCSRCADVNGDRQITPGDAQAAFDIYLGKISAPTWCQAENSDVNGDGGPASPRVTPADAQSIFQSYLGVAPVGGDCSGNSRVQAKAEQRPGNGPGVLLAIQQARPSPGQDIAIPVIVESPTEIGAFGFEVAFSPECLTFVAVERSDLTSDFDQVGGAVISSGASAGIQGGRVAVRRLLRVGGYTTDSRKRISPGVLVTLVFRGKENCLDTAPLSIVAAYDDVQDASFGLDAPSRLRQSETDRINPAITRRRS